MSRGGLQGQEQVQGAASPAQCLEPAGSKGSRGRKDILGSGSSPSAWGDSWLALNKDKCARPPPQLPPAPAPRPGPALAPAVALRRRPAAAFSTRLRRGASLSLSIRPLLAVPGRRPPGQAGKGSRRRARRPGCPEGTRRRRRPRPPRSRCRSPCRSPLPSCS